MALKITMSSNVETQKLSSWSRTHTNSIPTNVHPWTLRSLISPRVTERKEKIGTTLREGDADAEATREGTKGPSNGKEGKKKDRDRIYSGRESAVPTGESPFFPRDREAAPTRGPHAPGNPLTQTWGSRVNAPRRPCAKDIEQKFREAKFQTIITRIPEIRFFFPISDRMTYIYSPLQLIDLQILIS